MCCLLGHKAHSFDETHSYKVTATKERVTLNATHRGKRYKIHYTLTHGWSITYSSRFNVQDLDLLLDYIALAFITARIEQHERECA